VLTCIENATFLARKTTCSSSYM